MRGRRRRTARGRRHTPPLARVDAPSRPRPTGAWRGAAGPRRRRRRLTPLPYSRLPPSRPAGTPSSGTSVSRSSSTAHGSMSTGRRSRRDAPARTPRRTSPRWPPPPVPEGVGDPGRREAPAHRPRPGRAGCRERAAAGPARASGARSAPRPRARPPPRPLPRPSRRRERSREAGARPAPRGPGARSTRRWRAARRVAAVRDGPPALPGLARGRPRPRDGRGPARRVGAALVDRFFASARVGKVATMLVGPRSAYRPGASSARRLPPVSRGRPVGTTRFVVEGGASPYVHAAVPLTAIKRARMARQGARQASNPPGAKWRLGKARAVPARSRTGSAADLSSGLAAPSKPAYKRPHERTADVRRTHSAGVGPPQGRSDFSSHGPVYPGAAQ